MPEEVAVMKAKAFDYLNEEALKKNIVLSVDGTKITTLSDATMEYMYLVALGSVKLSGEYAKMFDYFLTKLGRNLVNGTMICKAQTAIILQKQGRRTEANEFIASIKEHLVQTDEIRSAFLLSMPILLYLGYDAGSCTCGCNGSPARGGRQRCFDEEMKLWLLKQKQTTSWNSPVATADAVYALLCQGSDLLENTKEMSASLWEIRYWRLSRLQRPLFRDWDTSRRSLFKAVLR